MMERNDTLAALHYTSSQAAAHHHHHREFRGFSAAAFGKFRHSDERYADLILNLHPIESCSSSGAVQDFPATCEFYHLMLEPEYQPLPPYTKSPESMKVFEEHKAMAYDYIRVKAELDLLLKRKQELAEELSRSRETVSTGAYTEADKFINEIMELQNERLSLRTLHNNLLLQLEMLKKPKERSDGWVMLP